MCISFYSLFVYRPGIFGPPARFDMMIWSTFRIVVAASMANFKADRLTCIKSYTPSLDDVFMLVLPGLFSKSTPTSLFPFECAARISEST